MIEAIEYNDWGVFASDTMSERKEKSIQSYYLDRTYSLVKDITFPTVFYSSIECIGSTLPWARCMVRYENKSPKDSEFWGPVQTKHEIERLFWTSLRSKTNPGKIYCVREWCPDIKIELRCFYSNRLVAVCGTDPVNSLHVESIVNWIEQNVIPRITFVRCVFDIGIRHDGSMIFIEFNSWEVNSGAHLFDWVESTDILYPSDNKSTDIVFRWKTDNNLLETKIVKSNIPCEYFQWKIEQLYSNIKFKIIDIKLLGSFEVLEAKAQNWLKMNDYVYAFTDIWLGKFDLNLQPVNWTRGNFRFCKISQSGPLIKISSNSHSDIYYGSDLRKYSNYQIFLDPNQNPNPNPNPNPNQNNLLDSTSYGLLYGIGLKTVSTNKIIFASLGPDCEFKFYQLN